MIDEAKRVITQIHQMEASLDDSKKRRGSREDDDLSITYPLSQCLRRLKEKHGQIKRLHQQRYEQVKSMIPALDMCFCFLSFAKSQLTISHRACRSIGILLISP